jgi:O-antigen/teichoic acid export membrane protein
MFLPRQMRITISIADQLLVSGSRFLIGIFAARLLGKSDYSMYVLLWSNILFITSLHSSIIISPLLTLGASSKNKRNSLFFTTLLFHDSALLFILSIPLLIYGVFENLSWGTIGFYILLMGVHHIQDFFRRYYYAINNIKFSLIVNIIYLLFIFAVIALMHLHNVNSIKIFFVFILCPSIICIAIFSRKFFIELPTIELFKDITKRVYNFSKHIALFSFTQFISGNLFVYASAYMLSKDSVADIGVVRNLFGPLMVLFIAIDNYLSPLAVRINEEKGTLALKKYLYRCILVCCGLIITFGVPLIIYSSEIISIIYGEGYENASSATLWFFLAHVIMFIVRPVSIYLKTLEITKPFAISGFVSLAITSLLCFPFINYFGLAGALALPVLQQLSNLISLLFFSMKTSDAQVRS